MYVLAEEEVRVTDGFEELSVVELPGLITGVAGAVRKVMVFAEESAEQLGPLYALTEYVPGVVIAILRVVAPFDQRYPLDWDDVSVNTVPGQTFNDPLAVTVGTAGAAFASTIIGAEVPAQLPPPVVTVNVPEFETVIDWVVAPFDHE